MSIVLIVAPWCPTGGVTVPLDAPGPRRGLEGRRHGLNVTTRRAHPRVSRFPGAGHRSLGAGRWAPGAGRWAASLVVAAPLVSGWSVPAIAEAAPPRCGAVPARAFPDVPGPTSTPPTSMRRLLRGSPSVPAAGGTSPGGPSVVTGWPRSWPTRRATCMHRIVGPAASPSLPRDHRHPVAGANRRSGFGRGVTPARGPTSRRGCAHPVR